MLMIMSTKCHGEGMSLWTVYHKYDYMKMIITILIIMVIMTMMILFMMTVMVVAKMSNGGTSQHNDD